MSLIASADTHSAPAARWRRRLPAGQTLPPEEFARRHRALRAVLLAHVVLLPLYGLLQGSSALHAAGELLVLGTFAAADRWLRTRKQKAICVALGLVTCSAMVVHLSGGVTEAHFHFFVVIVLLTLYEDWVAFLVAAAYVLLHHGLLGTLAPATVFDHPAAQVHPWRWAAIHAAFVAAAGAAAIAAWRLNEDVREAEKLATARAERAEAAARVALTELSRKNQDLEQFASVASHDLREPLRTVDGFLGLLQRRYGGQLGEEADEFIGYAVDGTRRMQVLIDDLLAWSRAGSQPPQLAPVDLGAIVRGKLEDLRARVEDSGADVRIGELPVVLGDARQLAQVLQNLLTNAMKFARPGVPPTVTVSAEAVGSEWIVSVQDDGIGIPPEEAERVFEMFSRAKGAARIEGTGIGLAICQRIVAAHGGRIWVDPVPGGGSAFRVVLPRPSAASEAVAAAHPQDALAPAV